MSHPQALDAALDLARRGFHVVPGAAGRKHPALPDWQHVATRDEAQIRSWWTDVYAGRPVIVACGTFTDPDTGEYWKLYVLDLDTKDGKDGVAELDAIVVHPIHGGELPCTLTVRTPSGGRHLIYKTHEELRQVVGWGHGVEVPGIAKAGIDTRAGDRGLIVGAGSVLPAGAYTIEVDAPVAEVPAWLATWIGRADTRERARGAVATTPSGETLELDTPWALRRAREYLEHHAPLAIEGSHGDATTVEVANRLLDHGVCEATALDLLAEHWNPRCLPPWNIGGIDAVGGQQSLADKVNSAAKSRHKDIGCDHPAVDFDAVEAANDNASADTPAGHAKPRRLFALRFADIEPVTQAWLVRNWLPAGGMSVVYGDSNSGKTTFATALALDIATGNPFAGNRVQQGAVVYVAAEAGNSARNRFVALRRRAGSDAPLFLVPCAVNLRSSTSDTAELAALVADCAARARCDVGMVVIDTLSRAFAGGDENTSTDMGAFVLNVDRLRAAAGNPHAMVVHHTGKDQARGARGHSLLRAATDAEIEVAADGVQRIARLTKQRDGEAAGRVVFLINGVEVGRDDEGAPITAPLASFLAKSAVEDFPRDDGRTPLDDDVDRVVRAMLAGQAKAPDGTKRLARSEVVKSVSVGRTPVLPMETAQKRVGSWWERIGRKSGVKAKGPKTRKTLIFPAGWEELGGA